MRYLQKLQSWYLAACLMAVSPFAFATDPGPYDALTASVDFSDMQAAVLLVIAALVGLVIVLAGGWLILSAVRRAKSS